MRILVTGDLHYDSPRSRAAAADMARRICRAGGDALVLVGDTASADYQPLRECLRLMAGFPGLRLLVPGNHCLWCLEGEDSLTRYERTLPAVAAEEGFVLLDHQPVVLEGVGLVGSVGWYDYSYRQEDLGIPVDFYRAKLAPGAARLSPEHRGLLEAHAERLGPRQLDISTRWMDGQHVRLGMSDDEFLDYLLLRLGAQLEAMDADASVRRVLAFLHHLPCRQLVPYGRPPPIAFAAAYMGSDRIGQTLAACRKLTHAYCGHSHWPARCRLGQAEVINVGSTYVEKNLEVLEIST